MSPVKGNTSPMHVRLRPIPFSAMQVSAINMEEIAAWLGPSAQIWDPVNYLYRAVEVKTKHGTAMARSGDWVAMNDKGEVFVYDRDTFASTFEVSK